MKCRFCPKQFFDDKDGLASKTIHEIIHNPRIINHEVLRSALFRGLGFDYTISKKRKERSPKEKRK